MTQTSYMHAVYALQFSLGSRSFSTILHGEGMCVGSSNQFALDTMQVGGYVHLATRKVSCCIVE